MRVGIIKAFRRGFGQLGDPALRTPVLWGVLGAGTALVILASVIGWGLAFALSGAVAGIPGWMVWVVQAVGSGLGMGLAWWLFLPVAVMIAGCFTGAVAAAVERRWYPGLGEARGASVAAQAWWGVRFGLAMLGLQLALLALALALPGVGAVLAVLVSARAMGVGFFEGTAQLRLGVAEATALRRRQPLAVWALGLGLVGLSLVPLLNLLVPVLGVAAAVHLIQGESASL